MKVWTASVDNPGEPARLPVDEANVDGLRKAVKEFESWTGPRRLIEITFQGKVLTSTDEVAGSESKNKYFYRLPFAETSRGVGGKLRCVKNVQHAGPYALCDAYSRQLQKESAVDNMEHY
jgi:hypothetical protein